MDNGETLLRGIRIIDLADEKAAFCSKLLADMGASVIKVEKPGGDPSRNMGPFKRGARSPEASLFFRYCNTNKRGITLDIEQDEGKKLLLRLLEKADVLIESFQPGYLQQLGLDFDTLKAANPGIILASLTPFGQNGPRSHYKGCDAVASAFGGQMSLSGTPSTPPLKPYGEQSYYVSSLFCAVGVLLAVRKRRLSGSGEHIDISCQEAVASTLDHALPRFLQEGIVPQRQGCLSGNRTSFILPCRDGHIYVNVSTQWDTLVEWMAGENMAEDLADERWREERYRTENIAHIIDIMGKWTATHSVPELFELAQCMRFPWAPVCSPRQVIDSPQLKAREFFISVDHEEVEAAALYPGPPYRIDNSPLKKLRRAPLIGEDNLRIYRDGLGLSDDELEEFFSRKVI